MKTREDFVSNSSSCSFVLSEGSAADGLKAFRACFGRDWIPYEVSEKIEVRCYVKNKWFREVETGLKGESSYEDSYRPWGTGAMQKKDPEEISWDSIGLSLDSLAGAAKDENAEILNKIDRVEFECEDSTEVGKFYLSLLYLFFERAGCAPDASDSEHGFRGDGSTFAARLATAALKPDKETWNGGKE